MLRRSIAVCLLGLLSVLAGVASAAPHAKGRHRSDAPFLPPLRVDASNGYKALVYANSEGEGGPEVTISLFDRRSQTAYSTAGEIGPDGFSASFGHLGWIDVRYEPGPNRIVKNCRGQAEEEIGGRYTGTFEFHGERHFAEIDYPELSVGPDSQYDENCFGVATGGGKGVKLEALSRYGTAQAIENRPGGPVRFTARAKDIEGKMEVFRYLEVFGPPKDFDWSPRLLSARIHPPAPFRGSGTFRASRPHRLWRGDLAVDFPDFPRYPLTIRPTLAFLEPGSCKVGGNHRFSPPPGCL
jgi:hypothetical protein